MMCCSEFSNSKARGQEPTQQPAQTAKPILTESDGTAPELCFQNFLETLSLNILSEFV